MAVLPRSPDTSALPEMMWKAVVDQSIASSRCEGSGAACNIQTVFHPAGWAVVRHMASSPHICRTCPLLAVQEHIISTWTVTHTERRVLVAVVAHFLDHFHENPVPENALCAADGAGLGRSAGPSDRLDAAAAVGGVRPELGVD